MKNKCVINGCGERGQWIWFTGCAYCAKHKSVLAERHCRSYRYPHKVTDIVGGCHEGHKVGKPRGWKHA